MTVDEDAAGSNSTIYAKVEWHNGELFPRVGFIVTNLTRPAKRVVRFYNQRGTAEQWTRRARTPSNGFQMAEVAVPRELFQTFLERIGRLRLAAMATG